MLFEVYKARRDIIEGANVHGGEEGGVPMQATATATATATAAPVAMATATAVPMATATPMATAVPSATVVATATAGGESERARSVQVCYTRRKPHRIGVRRRYKKGIELK